MAKGKQQISIQLSVIMLNVKGLQIQLKNKQFQIGFLKKKAKYMLITRDTPYNKEREWLKNRQKKNTTYKQQIFCIYLAKPEKKWYSYTNHRKQK